MLLLAERPFWTLSSIARTVSDGFDDALSPKGDGLRSRCIERCIPVCSEKKEAKRK